MTDSSERVVLVDEHNNPIGTAPKSAVHTAHTPLHRAFSVFLFDYDGNVLEQQRALSKKTWPGVWSNSCCGHPAPGESVWSAVGRRVEYELGISELQLHVMLPQFRYRAELDGIVENEVCPVFAGFSPQTPQPNATEVAAIRYRPWLQYAQDVLARPDKYSPWSVLEVQQLVALPELTKLIEHYTRVGQSLRQEQQPKTVHKDQREERS